MKVAVARLQVTVPATGVVPGPVRLKLVAGLLRVVQSIAVLKVAVTARVTGTPVAPLLGVIERTVGWIAVVKVET